jgi:hypothetical protein
VAISIIIIIIIIIKVILIVILIKIIIDQNLTLSKLCLNETYSTVRIGKHLSDNFLIQNGLKQGEASSPLLFNLLLNMPLGRSRKPGKTEIK